MCRQEGTTNDVEKTDIAQIATGASSVIIGVSKIQPRRRNAST